jgi:saccharopine dehydrogenase-like NADP-dependent oxidoreductase
MASQNSARYRHEGMLNVVPGKELLANASPLILNNALALETLPNRDSTVFADLYGLSSIPSFFRGTLRYRGFCERMLALARLGLLDQGPLPALKSGPSTLRQWLAQLLDISENVTADALRAEVERRLADLAGIPCSRLDDVSSSHIGSSSVGVAFIEWLGLFEEAPLPTGALADSPIDVMAQLLQRPEMAFQPGERDLVLMRHELMVQRSDGVLERRAATLIEYGQPHSHSAMARTVGVTAAICAQLVLDNPTRFGAGVQRPLRPEWYEPVLSQLANEGILLREHSEVIQKSQLLAKM